MLCVTRNAHSTHAMVADALRRRRHRRDWSPRNTERESAHGIWPLVTEPERAVRPPPPCASDLVSASPATAPMRVFWLLAWSPAPTQHQPHDARQESVRRGIDSSLSMTATDSHELCTPSASQVLQTRRDARHKAAAPFSEATEGFCFAVGASAAGRLGGGGGMEPRSCGAGACC